MNATQIRNKRQPKYGQIGARADPDTKTDYLSAQCQNHPSDIDSMDLWEPPDLSHPRFVPQTPPGPLEVILGEPPETSATRAALAKGSKPCNSRGFRLPQIRGAEKQGVVQSARELGQQDAVQHSGSIAV